MFQVIPATPMPLFVAAPMIPATCVRCPASSLGSPVPSTALKPWEPVGQVKTSHCVRVTVNGEGALRFARIGPDVYSRLRYR
jgi:hypothetical protein